MSKQDQHHDEYVRIVSKNATARSQVLLKSRWQIMNNIKNQKKEPSAVDMKDNVKIFKHLYPHGVKSFSLKPADQSVDLTPEERNQWEEQNCSASRLSTADQIMVFTRNTSSEILIKHRGPARKTSSETQTQTQPMIQTLTNSRISQK